MLFTFSFISLLFILILNISYFWLKNFILIRKRILFIIDYSFRRGSFQQEWIYQFQRNCVRTGLSLRTNVSKIKEKMKITVKKRLSKTYHFQNQNGFFFLPCWNRLSKKDSANSMCTLYTVLHGNKAWKN